MHGVVSQLHRKNRALPVVTKAAYRKSYGLATKYKTPNLRLLLQPC